MTRLTLANGQWIDVKDKLKVRDKENISTFSGDGVSSDGKNLRINMYRYQMATAAVYIKNWSITDDGRLHKDQVPRVIPWPSVEKPFGDRIEVLRDLDEDVINEINELLTKHQKALAPKEDEEKNEIPAGESGSGTSSPSVN